MRFEWSWTLIPCLDNRWRRVSFAFVKMKTESTLIEIMMFTGNKSTMSSDRLVLGLNPFQNQKPRPSEIQCQIFNQTFSYRFTRVHWDSTLLMPIQMRMESLMRFPWWMSLINWLRITARFVMLDQRVKRWVTCPLEVASISPTINWRLIDEFHYFRWNIRLPSKSSTEKSISRKKWINQLNHKHHSSRFREKIKSWGRNQDPQINNLVS